MLNYAVYCELQKKLNKLCELTPLLFKSPGSFFQGAIDYTAELEEFAVRCNLASLPADIASVRCKLITYMPKPFEEGSPRRNERKLKDKYAAEAISDIIGSVNGFCDKGRQVFEECEQLWRQILSSAVLKGILKPALSAGNVIDIIKNDADLAAYYSHITGLCGTLNALAILNVVLPQLNL